MNDAPDANPLVVLVVEDDPLQRMMAVDLVDAVGLIAIEATDAPQALQILEQRSDVTLLFTDIDMPRGKDGLWLAWQVSERWPTIRLALISGKRHLEPSELPPKAQFFPKPYVEEQVVRFLRCVR